MTLSFDLFWSFRSPYCYLALDRILDIHCRYDVEVRVRPVYPLAVRTPDFFQRVHRNYRRYNLLDTKRLAEYYGIPFRRPVPDPIVQDLETNEIAPEQPYIFRLTRLGVAAAEAGKGPDFLDQVARIVWDGTVDGWNEGNHLRDAAARAGLDIDTLDRLIAAEPDRYDAIIRQSQQNHVDAGHWGVPTMVFEGEPFYGQDRIDLLLWRLRQKGLRERS